MSLLAGRSDLKKPKLYYLRLCSKLFDPVFWNFKEKAQNFLEKSFQYLTTSDCFISQMAESLIKFSKNQK